jgi:hypothetical protein
MKSGLVVTRRWGNSATFWPEAMCMRHAQRRTQVPAVCANGNTDAMRALAQ